MEMRLQSRNVSWRQLGTTQDRECWGKKQAECQRLYMKRLNNSEGKMQVALKLHTIHRVEQNSRISATVLLLFFNNGREG